MSPRLPDSAHTDRLWRIHEIAPDFRLEDVWALPTPGGPDDFPRLVKLMAARDPSRGGSRAVKLLFALRWKLGAVFGWDKPSAATIAGRLPDDLRARPAPRLAGLPFSPLYLLDDEWAAELANATAHGVVHLGWVADGHGGHRGQLAVLVKPNGRLGRAYMTAIRPFRLRIVYPRMMQDIGRRWACDPR